MTFDSDWEKIEMRELYDEICTTLTAYETGETDAPVTERDLYALLVKVQNALCEVI